MGNGIDDGEDYSISAGKIKQAGFIYPCYYQPFTARKNRGDCYLFEPLPNTFLEILLNNNQELQLALQLARKYA